MTPRDDWRWADPTGQQRLVRTDELRAGLASGVIPPNAPVWRRGWKEWRPAHDVAELSTNALAAVHGIVPNIPPPPLEVVAVQAAFEREAERKGAPEPAVTEPPLPPRYVPMPVRTSSFPPMSHRGGRTLLFPKQQELGPDSGEDALPFSQRTTKPSGPAEARAPIDTGSTSVDVDMDLTGETEVDRISQSLFEQTETTVRPAKVPVSAPMLDDELTDSALLSTLPRPAAGHPPPVTSGGASGASNGGVNGVERAPLGRLGQRTAPVGLVAPSPAIPRVSPIPAVPLRPSPLPPRASPAPGFVFHESKSVVAAAPAAGKGKGAPPPPAAKRSSPPPKPPGKPSVPPAKPSAPPPAKASSPPPKPGAIPAPKGAPPAGAPRTPAPPAPAQAPAAADSFLDADISTSSSSLDALTEVRVPSPGAAGSAPPPVPSPLGGQGSSAPPAMPVKTMVMAAQPLPGAGAASGGPRPTGTSAAPASSLGGFGKSMRSPQRSMLHDIARLSRVAPRWALGVLGGGVLLGLSVSLGLVVASVRQGTRSAAAAAPSSTVARTGEPATAGEAPAASTNPCALHGPSRVLTAKVVPSAGVTAGVVGGKLVVGLAPQPKVAAAYELDPEGLRVLRSVQAKAADAVRRAQPIGQGGGLAVVAQIDARNDALEGRRTFLPDAPFDVGVHAGAIAVAGRGERVVLPLWPVDGPVEGFRAAAWRRPHGEDGVALAFRKNGEILGGTLTPPPAAAAEGQLVHLGGRAVAGPPAIAAEGGRALVAWVERAGPRPALQLVFWLKGTAPSAPFTVAAAGANGAEVVGAPAVTSAGHGRFAVAWTEVNGPSAFVRVAVLGEEGALLGEPLASAALEQSPAALDVAVAESGRGLLAYLMPVGKGAELAALPLVCAE